MTRRILPGYRRSTCAPNAALCRGACLLLALFSAAAAGLAAEPSADPETLLDESLAAGEFAPALELALQAAPAARHDAWLARVAIAQAASGAQRAALHTSAEIYDDRARTRTLRQVAREPLGGRGGGAQPDFDALIDLISATIAPNSWAEVGGPGAIDEFAGGVYVDPQGVLRQIARTETSGGLAALRATLASALPAEDTAPGVGVRRSVRLRMVSLPRLEKQVQMRLALGQPPDEAMQVLAGLEKIRFVFVYPESGDLVLAGPAGDWKPVDEGRLVSVRSGQPVLRLDDLLVVLRAMAASGDATFGCSIRPVQENLARTQAFLDQSKRTPLRPGQREAWLKKLRDQLGRQEIDVFGLDPRSRVARVMVEADYRMKLVGMGLEEGVLGVDSYLDLVKVPPGQAPPPMDVLRWWFTLNYQALLATPDGNGFEIRGQGVQVLSENELLTAQGKRVHTGKSDALNQQFAQSFTAAFPALAEKYPIYAELRNVFDLALVGALLRAQGLPEKVGWHMTCFGDAEALPTEQGPAPTQVESVINHRVINRVHIVAGVSGGVTVDPRPLVAPGAIAIDNYGKLQAELVGTVPPELPGEAWWWDPR